MSKSVWKAILATAGITEAAFLGAGLAGLTLNLRRRPEWNDGIHILSQDDMLNDYYRRKNLEWVHLQRAEKWELTSFDGLKLSALYVYNSKQKDIANRKIVLFSHGYGGKGLWDMGTFVDYYSEKGYDMLFPDQRTHGESEGDYIGFGALESWDLYGWSRELIKKWNGDCSIVMHGWSMGASSAYLAITRGMPSQVKGLVFDCGYCSCYEEFMNVIRHRMNLPDFILHYIVLHMDVWCRILAKFRMDEAAPLKYADRMTLPVLFVHGAEDKFVPTWMSTKLYKATKNAVYKEQLIVPKAGHVMSYVYGRKEYQQAIDRLISNCME